MEYSYHLRQRFPSLQITAEVLQPPPHGVLAAQVIGVAQIGGFVIAFFGDAIFTALSQPTPPWAKSLQENKGMCIGIFFVGNLLVNSFTQTGAFEVYLGGELVHSKIKTGVVPDFNQLVDRIQTMNPAVSAPVPSEDKDRRRIDTSGKSNSKAQAKKRHVSLDDEDEEF